MRSFAVIVLAVASPALAVTCPSGVGKLHGVCQQLALAPAPLAKVQPKIGQKVRSGDSYSNLWFDKRTRSGFEGTTTASVDGASISNSRITDPGEYGISFCNATHVTITGVQISMSKPSTSTVPSGISFGRKGCGVTGSDILIQNTVVSGIRGVDSSGYDNGDDIATEDGYTRVTIRNTTASDATDGCYDLKSQTLLDNVSAYRCHRNYRLWGDDEGTYVYSTDATGAHVWINAKSAQTVLIHNLIVRSTTTAPVLRIENSYPVNVTIEHCDIQVPTGTPLLWGGKNAHLVLDSSCKLN